MNRKEKGFSLVESMVAIGIATIIMGAFVPNFFGVMRTYRRDGVVDRIAGDVRKTRSAAIMTGWQYRVFGFNAGGTSAYKNQYRIMARSSSAIAWPADTVAPMQSATQMAGSWININTLYPGVKVNPTDATPDFSVAFDSRGVRVDLDSSFDPLVIVSETGSSKSLRVSAVGSATIQ